MTTPAVAVVPARNEAPRLPETLSALVTLPAVQHVVVVDDGSMDNTSEVAAAFGAEVVRLPPRRRGDKGRALLSGIVHARRHNPDAVLLADADLGASAARLRPLLDGLYGAPVAVAAFPPAEGAGFGLVKRLARCEISRRTGFAPREPLSGQRALLAGALDLLPGLAPGFGVEVGMTLDLLAAGIQPLEIPLPLSHRPTGRGPSGFAHRARQGLDVLRALQGSRIPW
ncbi:glycosyltransferase [Rubrobacter taiwanensis]|uniref:Glycosyltransferase n=1 Tax=Rubrobacter taiwanensis TaxID=185139 RepID=A0A4R1BJ58_9ACTN|nr:glycosyltransferase [Rubrobacter taiwanensis]